MKRVLLVEDDDGVAEIVELTLQDSGYVVDRVCTVADALVSAESELPAAVLLDLSLPGMSGLAFLRTCRASGTLASLPIALMSGTQISTMEDGLTPDAVLTKPFDIDELCTVVDELTRCPGSTIGDAVPRA